VAAIVTTAAHQKANMVPVGIQKSPNHFCYGNTGQKYPIGVFVFLMY